MSKHPWLLGLQGQFSDAIEILDSQLLVNRDASILANRGIMLLNMGRVAEALEDFVEVVSNSGTSTDVSHTFVGTAHWLLGNVDAAIRAWRVGLSAQFTDSAGGVELPGILLYAACVIDDNSLARESLTLLKKRWKPQKVVRWPMAIPGLHLGHLEPAQLETTLSSNPIVRAKEKCQADFHIGLYYLRQSHPEVATPYFTSATGFLEALAKPERYLAKAEIARTS